MFVSNVLNVCQALPATIKLLERHGHREQSRAGDVLVLPAPLMTVTERPCERVLRSAIRDANPFFHMVEAIWMLAGKSDAATLNHYVRDFGERFAEVERQRGEPLAENSGEIHDAYGRRWRRSFGMDQLDAMVERLIENPNDRQCVIQMWDAHPEGDNDLYGSWKTRPCNTHLYLRYHDGRLDMTVCCRSNDMIWGGHGANAVHFSILQEYLAARIDTRIGKLYQLSNNAHVYIDELARLNTRIHPSESLSDMLMDDHYRDRVQPRGIFTEPTEADADILMFMRWHVGWHQGEKDWTPEYANTWFESTLSRAVRAYHEFRSKRMDVALGFASNIGAEDWRAACVEWLSRRNK
jgi:thymidylate synthase